MSPVDLAWLLVAQYEGFRPTVYQDQHGTWTIGFGRTGPDVTASTPPTTREAEEAWTKGRLSWLWQRIDHDVGRDLNVNQAAALLSFAYNAGLARTERSSVWSFVQAGQWLPAANALLLYDKVHLPSGTPVTDPGLVKRRKAERDLFLAPPPVTLA